MSPVSQEETHVLPSPQDQATLLTDSFLMANPRGPLETHHTSLTLPQEGALLSHRLPHAPAMQRLHRSGSKLFLSHWKLDSLEVGQYPPALGPSLQLLAVPFLSLTFYPSPCDPLTSPSAGDLPWAFLTGSLGTLYGPTHKLPVL